jgi:hypothetical protein
LIRTTLTALSSGTSTSLVYRSFASTTYDIPSLLIAAGVHPKAIQARLGHASITTTLDTYGHLMPSAFQGVGSRLETLLQGTQKAHSPDTNEAKCRRVHKSLDRRGV